MAGKRNRERKSSIRNEEKRERKEVNRCKDKERRSSFGIGNRGAI